MCFFHVSCCVLRLLFALAGGWYLLLIVYLLLSFVRELLHTQRKQHETCEKLNAVLGESLYSCEIGLADSFQHGFSCLPPEVAEILGLELSDNGFCSQTPASDMKRLKKVDLKIDNSLIPSYTLLQIHCVDQKGLLYDVMRTLKDYKIQVPIIFIWILSI